MDGRALRQARTAAGLSLSALAARVNYSKPYLAQLETGRRAVRAEHVTAYETALVVEIRAVPAAGERDAQLLSEAADLVTAVGLRHGGASAVGIASAQWEWASALLDGPARDATRARLMPEAARLADRLAWSLADSGSRGRAAELFTVALDLAEGFPDARCLVRTNLGQHQLSEGRPREALSILDGLTGATPTHEFRIQSTRARAHAVLGDRAAAVRHVGLADEAHAGVDIRAVPTSHRPYLSGHAAHADREAGKVFGILAEAGDRAARAKAADRLRRAIEAFGPDRARAVARCEARLRRLGV